MHVLVIGALGQLGRPLVKVFADKVGHRVTAWDVGEIDITQPGTVDVIARLAPDLVINSAAWTNVDAAEARPDAAYAVNALGPKYLAAGCARCGAAMVQISTNEVFPGAPGTFYREYDQTTMAGSTYARSKLAGERAAAQMTDRLYLVRIAWLFGPGGVNFPTKIVAAADKHGALRVVTDETGNPCYAPDVAVAISRLVETGHFGNYHLVNSGYCNRYELAQAVLAASGRSAVAVTPIDSGEWTRPTQPPPHAVLINQAGAALGIVLRPWQEAVAEYATNELKGNNG